MLKYIIINMFKFCLSIFFISFPIINLTLIMQSLHMKRIHSNDFLIAINSSICLFFVKLKYTTRSAFNKGMQTSGSKWLMYHKPTFIHAFIHSSNLSMTWVELSMVFSVI